jgi:hypothetical protein
MVVLAAILIRGNIIVTPSILETVHNKTCRKQSPVEMYRESLSHRRRLFFSSSVLSANRHFTIPPYHCYYRPISCVTVLSK